MPPNIVLFMTDQHRYDCLGCYGNDVISTPNIDTIAAAGTRFDRAYVQNPICMPSRATLLTGLYPRNHRLWTNGCPFSVGAPTLPGYLAEQGYTTASVGKIHLNPFSSTSETYYQESRSYWDAHPEMNDWHGPYVGFQHVQLVRIVHRDAPYTRIQGCGQLGQ